MQYISIKQQPHCDKNKLSPETAIKIMPCHVKRLAKMPGFPHSFHFIAQGFQFIHYIIAAGASL